MRLYRFQAGSSLDFAAASWRWRAAGADIIRPDMSRYGGGVGVDHSGRGRHVAVDGIDRCAGPRADVGPATMVHRPVRGDHRFRPLRLDTCAGRRRSCCSSRRWRRASSLPSPGRSLPRPWCGSASCSRRSACRGSRSRSANAGSAGVRPSARGPFAYEPFSWRPEHASLPSGHATTAFAALVAIGLISPRLRPVLWVYALLIAASRIGSAPIIRAMSLPARRLGFAEP